MRKATERVAQLETKKRKKVGQTKCPVFDAPLFEPLETTIARARAEGLDGPLLIIPRFRDRQHWEKSCFEYQSWALAHPDPTAEEREEAFRKTHA